MRILYVAHRYDYGRPELGLSYEHHNFFESLCAMGHEVDYFDLGAHLHARGRDAMNETLSARARSTAPDLMFSFMFEDELEPDVVRGISNHTMTFNWFADDHWRFESFTSRWAHCFTWVSTTASSALPKYAAIGYRNVIKTQWAAATSRYQKHGLPLVHDVTFVGQAYGDRPDVVQRLRKAGVPVRTYGRGWRVRPEHRLAARLPVIRSLGGAALLRRVEATTRCDQDEMLAIFEQSRINLNLVAASQGGGSQIKGRTFEVPACGGFLLDGPAEGLAEYFDIGRELVVYEDVDDMAEKCRFYLTHDDARARIARAGHRRVHREHTYVERFRHIFAAMGLR